MKLKRVIAGAAVLAGSLLLSSSNRALPPLVHNAPLEEQAVGVEVLEEEEEILILRMGDIPGAGGPTIPIIGDTPGTDGSINAELIPEELKEILDSDSPDHMNTTPPPDVMYCGENLTVYEELYPEEFAVARAAHSPYERLRCLQGPAPAGARILDVPYYNQCDFPDSKKGVCASGCGPTAVKMVLEYMDLREQDIDSLWEELWTGYSGTEPSRIAWALLSRNMLGEWRTKISREDIEKRIDNGYPIIIHSKPLGTKAPYQDERFCGENCRTSGHYMVIIGTYEEGVVMHDPYTTFPWDTENFKKGKNMLISWEALEEQFTWTANNLFVLIPEEETLTRMEERENTLERYTGELTYCGDSRGFLEAANLEELLASSAVTALDRRGICVSGPAPENAIIWDVPFYSQSYFENKVMLNGCGVVTLKMALETLGYQWVDVSRLYKEVDTTPYGTPLGGMMLSAFNRGVYGGVTEDMPWSELKEHVSKGHLIIMNTYSDSYGMEKYCLDNCAKRIGHYLLIVGIDSEEKAVIVQDSTAGSISERGKYLVLSWDTLENNIYPDGDRGQQLIFVSPE